VKGISPTLSPPIAALLPKVQINVPFPLLVKNLERVLDIGLQPEIYFNAATLDELNWAEVRKASRELGRKNLPVTFHGPFMDLNPGAVDEKIREVTLRRFEQVFALAPFFQPRAIVFHPGYDRWRYDNNVDLWLEKSLLTWKPLAERAETLSVKLAIENVFEDHPSSLRKLFSALDSPWVGYCLDAGHGNLFSRGAITEWLDALGSRLVEMHLHDNNCQADEHLPLGEGCIDFAAIFAYLREKRLNPILTLEPHLAEHLEPSLKALGKYLGELGIEQRA
jgi:sugar phosphate isomerase/epimerase